MKYPSTELAIIPFFDYHGIGDKECSACYCKPTRQDCGGLLHNHLTNSIPNLPYAILWRCDLCGGSHQYEDSD